MHNCEIVAALFPLSVSLTFDDSMSGLEGTVRMSWYTGLQTCIHGTLSPDAVLRNPSPYT